MEEIEGLKKQLEIARQKAEKNPNTYLYDYQRLQKKYNDATLAGAEPRKSNRINAGIPPVKYGGGDVPVSYWQNNEQLPAFMNGPKGAYDTFDMRKVKLPKNHPQQTVLEETENPFIVVENGM